MKSIFKSTYKQALKRRYLSNSGKLWVLAGITILFAASCKKTDYLNINAADRPSLAAHISFVNARPVNTGIQFWVYTTQVTKTALAINTKSDYIDTQFGDVQINFTEGTNTSYKASRQFGNSATFTSTGGPNGPIANYYHTVFAVKNTKATADSLILFYDDLSAPAAGKAKVRFVNLAPGAPNVDFGIAGQTALFTNTAYGRAGGSVLSGTGLSAWSLGPFVTVDAGTVNFSITQSSDQSAVNITGDKLKGVTLTAGKIYTIYINGTPGSSAIGATILTHN
ncbi:protein of unknown function [Mucilaginibacter gossypiicola]|uniref:DUF4397 domain-containing protein n=1 Tax=Mucilaginibacter gossypiicola TaxID=551995 RepID=A0A1H8BR00_9SPHI|nr:DUF4397 domain-containing protein [Mucilaginibacter gossypiicola]SEM85285.1 protein of unknown function [Mucilaginibacter gossypiicola]